jgi:hypothetical protein
MDEPEPKQSWLARKWDSRLGRLQIRCVAWGIGLMAVAWTLIGVWPALRSFLGGPAMVSWPMMLVSPVITLFAIRSRRILRTARSTNFRTCKHCGYDLRAIEEPGPCPECGRAFTAGELRVYWETQTR